MDLNATVLIVTEGYSIRCRGGRLARGRTLLSRSPFDPSHWLNGVRQLTLRRRFRDWVQTSYRSLCSRQASFCSSKVSRQTLPESPMRRSSLPRLALLWQRSGSLASGADALRDRARNKRLPSGWRPSCSASSFRRCGPRNSGTIWLVLDCERCNNSEGVVLPEPVAEES